MDAAVAVRFALRQAVAAVTLLTVTNSNIAHTYSSEAIVGTCRVVTATVWCPDAVRMQTTVDITHTLQRSSVNEKFSSEKLKNGITIPCNCSHCHQ